jgi:trigger factor
VVADMAEQAGTTGADLRRRLDRAGRLPAVRSDQRKAKALEWLIDHVALVDEEGTPVDRDDLLPDPVMQAEGNEVTTGDVDTTSDGSGERGSEDVRAEEGATVEAEA